jgi:L-lactate dehydrogenase complex protein LldG
LVTTPGSSLDDQYALFSERATPLGSNVQRVANAAELADLVKSIADSAGVTEIAVSRPVADAAPATLARLTELGIAIDIISDRDGARDRAVGLSLAYRGIAETGSVVLDERYIQDRATSLMTLHNVVLVRTRDLVPSLDVMPNLLREIATAGPGGYASLVTGPSRTADIEMSLTVGVQGPNQISMIFVDELT